MRFDKYIVPIVPSFDAAPLYQDLVAAITTLFTVYTGVQIKFTFFSKNKNAFSPGWPNKGYVLGRHFQGTQTLKRARLYPGPQ